MKILIGTKIYTSKKELTSDVRQRLKAIRESKATVTSGIEFDFFTELFKRHYNYKEKSKAGIKAFRVDQIQKGDCIFIIRNDNTEDDISWLSCISGKSYTNLDDLIPLLRDAINDQMITYRDSALRACIACHDTKFMSVDHIVPFSKLVNDFLLIEVKVPSTFDDVLGQGYKFKPEDSKFVEAWIAYHKKEATYQILCRSCNSSKGAKLDHKFAEIVVADDMDAYY